LNVHFMKEERKDKCRDEAGEQRSKVCGPALLRISSAFDLSLGRSPISRIQGFGEKERRIPQKPHNHGGKSCDQDGEEIETVHVHGWLP